MRASVICKLKALVWTANILNPNGLIRGTQAARMVHACMWRCSKKLKVLHSGAPPEKSFTAFPFFFFDSEWYDYDASRAFESE